MNRRMSFIITGLELFSRIEQCTDHGDSSIWFLTSAVLLS